MGITRYYIKDAIQCHWFWNYMYLIWQNTDLRNRRIFLWLVNGVWVVDSHSQSVENTDKHTDIDGEITICLGTVAQFIVSNIKRFQCTVQHTSLGLNLEKSLIRHMINFLFTQTIFFWWCSTILGKRVTRKEYLLKKHFKRMEQLLSF